MLRVAGPDEERRSRALFLAEPDGTRRSSRALFEGEGMTGFVGKHAQLTRDTERRLAVAYQTISRFSPAWAGRFANAYVITPENAVMMFWPGEPWALNASDWEISGKLSLIQGGAEPGLVVVAGTPSAEAGDGPRWSGLYFDYAVQDWVVSVTRAVHAGEHYVATVGHDLLLQDLIERVVTSDIDGAYNLLIDQKGRLIAHPDFMGAIQAHSGAIPIAESEDAHLQSLFAVAETLGAKGGIVDLPEYDQFVVSTQLAGPGWYLLTVFPKEIVAAQAKDLAYLILGLGVLALIIELSMLSGILRRDVGEPLSALAGVAERIGKGETTEAEAQAEALAGLAGTSWALSPRPSRACRPRSGAARPISPKAMRRSPG